MKLKEQAKKEYIRRLKRIARGVKRGTRRSHRWLDDAESAMRSVRAEYHEQVGKMGLLYSKECEQKREITSALDWVDKDLFFSQTVQMYSFTDERLLEVLEW